MRTKYSISNKNVLTKTKTKKYIRIKIIKPIKI